MGRKDDAKAFYSDLQDKFPKTAEGKLAKKRLKAKK
jgi:TolA-binding protein